MCKGQIGEKRIAEVLFLVLTSINNYGHICNVRDEMRVESGYNRISARIPEHTGIIRV